MMVGVIVARSKNNMIGKTAFSIGQENKERNRFEKIC